MTVDMHERKFMRRLRGLPAFQRTGISINEEVWRIKLPAWRALFTSLLLYDHSTGYRLPTFDQFYRNCLAAYTRKPSDADENHIRRVDELSKWFDGKYQPQVEERLRVFYESGMAETYLYVCLVDAFEDALNEGVVFYDARHDWKLKGDMTAVVRGEIFLVSQFMGSIEGRPAVEARRDIIEHERKQNTMNSAHWKNQELKRWTKLEVSVIEEDCQLVNGLHLPSYDAIHKLIDHICKETGIDKRVRFPAKPGEDIPQVLSLEQAQSWSHVSSR